MPLNWSNSSQTIGRYFAQNWEKKRLPQIGKLHVVTHTVLKWKHALNTNAGSFLNGSSYWDKINKALRKSLRPWQLSRTPTEYFIMKNALTCSGEHILLDTPRKMIIWFCIRKYNTNWNERNATPLTLGYHRRNHVLFNLLGINKKFWALGLKNGCSPILKFTSMITSHKVNFFRVLSP